MANSDDDDAILLVEEDRAETVPHANDVALFPDGGRSHALVWADGVDAGELEPIDLARVSKEAIETAVTEPPDPGNARSKWDGVVILVCAETHCQGSIGAFRCTNCGFIGTFEVDLLGLPDCPNCRQVDP